MNAENREPHSSPEGQMARKEDKCLLAKIIFAVIGAISGVSIFSSFVAFRNVNAAIWGLLSTVFAIMVLRLHLAYRRDDLHLKYTPNLLRILMQFGAFGSFASILASAVYFALAAALHQGYKLEDNGYMPAGIFALLNLKWTAALFWFSRKYRKTLNPEEEVTPIAEEAHSQNYT